MYRSVAIAFLPGAHPTYIPLGVASLFAWLKQRDGQFSVSAHDLSIKSWCVVTGNDFEKNHTALFFRGHTDGFYDRAQFQEFKSRLAELYYEKQQIEELLNDYLQNGIASSSLHNYFTELGLDELSHKDFIAFSLLYTGQLIYLLAFSRYLKEQNPAIVITAGGAAMSALDVEELLDSSPWIDMVFRGEGEQGLEALITGTDPASIRGLSYRSNGYIQHNPRPRSIPLEQLPTPDFSFTDLSLYYTAEPVLPVLFSRGCKWRKCRFCSHNFSFAGYRTEQHILFVDKLLHYQTLYGVNHFYFADQYIDAEDLRAIAEELIRRNATIFWHVMGRPTADYTYGILKTLRQSGCCWISWGVESFSDTLLETCNKGTSSEVVKTVLKNSHKAGISNLAMMIFGMPGSNDIEFQKTIDGATELSASVDAFTSSSFQLFQGTPFYTKRELFGIVESGKREEVIQTAYGSIHSNRIQYTILDTDGQHILPHGPKEVDQWSSWKLWVRGGDSFYEDLMSEHYLLFIAKENRVPQETPLQPNNTKPKGDGGSKPGRYSRAG